MSYKYIVPKKHTKTSHIKTCDCYFCHHSIHIDETYPECGTGKMIKYFPKSNSIPLCDVCQSLYNQEEYLKIKVDYGRLNHEIFSYMTPDEIREYRQTYLREQLIFFDDGEDQTSRLIEEKFTELYNTIHQKEQVFPVVEC